MFCLQTHLHADFESLYKEVPKRLLPEEYGGEAGPLDVLIGEWGVLLSIHKNFQFTQAGPILYVAHFDIETQVALKPPLTTSGKAWHMGCEGLNKCRYKQTNTNLLFKLSPCCKCNLFLFG